MPIQHSPQDDQNWKVSYAPDATPDIISAFNISLSANPGKITTTRRIQPHTTSVVTSSEEPPSSYIQTNADGTLRYWKHWDSLYKTNSTTTAFSIDTRTNTPSAPDGDLEVFGRTEDGRYDVLYATSHDGENIARFNRDVSTTTWVADYWTGVIKEIGDTDASGTLIEVETTAAHGFNTGDKVIIRDCDDQPTNGTWTITVVNATKFTLDDSVWNADGDTGTVNRIFDSSTNTTYLGQPILNDNYETILKRFSSAQQDLLFVGNDNMVHTIDLQQNVVYSRVVFFKDYFCNWIQVTKDRVYIGFQNKNSFVRHTYVVEYDPLTEAANPVINTNGSTTGFVYEDICHIFDVKGWISRFNSNGFTRIAAFPLAYVDGLRYARPHRNSIAILDDRPHILFSGRSGTGTSTYSQISPAGLWCWDPLSNQLYHKGSLAQSNSTESDYGASYTGSRGQGYGALFSLPSITAKTQDFFAGGEVNDQLSGLNRVIGTFSTVVVSGATSFANRGWIVTRKYHSTHINAIWRNILVDYDPNQYPLGLQSGALLVKYRVADPIDDCSYYDTGTWVSPTTFTVSLASVPNLSVGNEIFITLGKGCGLSAHVTDITGTTVTIDESVTTPSGTFTFVYENWTKLTDETFTDGQIDDNTDNNWMFDIPENEDCWIQFKVEIRAAGTTPFRGMALEALGLGYQENLRQEGSQRDSK